ncbi:Maf family protein [Alcaligenes faecalis]|uniref:Maf family protein n=1 Tax=Alcaligenes faecalis TaxID=511 RepID=UPI000B4C232A|nr:Maf family protein [Alcaligenes faecalis]ASC89342.1 septum formation inhibitor Maf [Alcaligenes faecalis]
MPFQPIYLASASPRRHDLLNSIQITHEVLHVPSPPGEDEPRLEQEAVLDYVRRTARDKLLRALEWRAQDSSLDQERAILSADTTVCMDEDIFGKPADLADAARILRELSGRRHKVMTALSLGVGGVEFESISISEVSFKTLNEQEIAEYCASGEPMGKAGAYGIQGLGGAFISHLSGSYTGVMGLPVHETYRLLELANLKIRRPG